ncbi:MAG: hypothetical protein PHU44_17955 [Syntrophales bacterium]|nr:hypothetical protein [Syntrophales bacterium]MDD5641255.1 hypothetical protein [Syntrophales bacterium]
MKLRHAKVVYWGVIPTVLSAVVTLLGTLLRVPAVHFLGKCALFIGLTGLILALATGFKLKGFQKGNAQVQAILQKHKRLSIILVGIVFFLTLVRLLAEPLFLKTIHPPYLVLSIISVGLVLAVRYFGSQLTLSKK